MTMPDVRRGLVALLAAVLVTGSAPWTDAAVSSADRAIGVAGFRVRRNPYDAAAYFRLGDGLIQKARETGDTAYWSRAEHALRTALGLAPDYAAAHRHLAYVLYSRHEFAAAATAAARAIELDPSDGHAYGILGDAQLEVGQYRGAEATYRTMMARQADLYAYARLAGLKAMRGDPKGAIRLLERAVDEGRRARRPRESIAWAEWQLGSEHFTIGDLGAAEARYRASLAAYPGYHRGLAGLAQVRAARGDFARAIELYEKAIAVVPLPEYVVALGDVHARVGRPEAAQRQYELVEYIGRLSALNQALYNRELAVFYADHDLKLDEALRLARRELEIRQDIYAWDLLAWALYKRGNLTEARSASVQALKLGTVDPRLFFHAGLIHLALGEARLAKQYLQRALATNPRFHVLHAAQAERALRTAVTAAASVSRREP
jgi:tetratricopeptide (TPR) repeat protein